MKTINLLPKTRQEELRYENILHGIIVLIWLSAASFVLVFLAQFGAKLYIQGRTQNIQGSIQTLQSQISKQNNDALNGQITALNNTITDYASLTAGAPQWSRAIIALTPLPPAGVVINSFSADASTRQASITGFSPTRDLVIQLYNNIASDSKDFTNIDYPLENVVNPVKVTFHFEFTIQPTLLQ